MSKTFILYNNNFGNLLTKFVKKSCQINNQVTYQIFVSNDLVDFSKSM